MNKLIISLAAAILSLPVAADEGMWLLPLLKGQRFPEMQALGLKLQDYDIYSPDSASLKDAVVIFGGGCTGEIVSPEGLLLTNHHCGYGCIQRHSTLEHDYLTDGFWAMSRDQELPNPGMTVTFIDKIEDVTDYVKKELEKDTDPNSMNFLSPKFLNGLAKAKVGEKFLQDNPGTEVEIKAFYGVLWRQPVFHVHKENLFRHPPGRSSSLIDRKVRRRYRQLDVAAPYGRLFGFPGLCR